MNAETVDRLAEALDHHWLYQGIDKGVALCTCGEWSFDAQSGRAPLPVMGERFAPFSHHVADAIRRLATDEDARLRSIERAARNLSDRRTLDSDGFWVSQKEMNALDRALDGAR